MLRREHDGHDPQHRHPRESRRRHGHRGRRSPHLVRRGHSRRGALCPRAQHRHGQRRPRVSAGDAAADGGGLEIDGQATIRDTLVARNSVVVEAARAALAQGGGIANAGQLTAERLLVLDNTVSAKGAGGRLPFDAPSAAQGGGIWNGSFGNPTPPGLTLTGSAILRNSAAAGAGFLVQGGGLYTDFPIGLTRTAIAANQPDQCFGC
jgi:hypothetical protein